MSFFSTWLRQRRRTALIFVLFSVIFAVSFALYRLPLKVVLYPALLCALTGAAAAALDYRRMRRRHEQLQHIGRLSAELIDGLPAPETIADEDHQRIIRMLCDEHRAMEARMTGRFDDMVNYYTVWAHQIKTPIAAMRLQLQNEDSPLSRALSSELLRIEQYVEMVLAFLRLDSNSSDYVFKMHELDPLLRQSIRRFSSEFINRKLILSYTPPSDESGTLKMITDDKWFCFVIEQLLSNALKYTRAGTISIFFSQPKVLCLKDTGIGIAPQDLPRIFEKGYTGCNGRTDKKASGLGLYLCKRICKNLGIGISITSEVDNGTCVYLSLDQYPLKAE